MTTPAQNSAAIAPSRFDAVIFDLDGVVTRTASVHAAAWKQLFDEYREERLRRGLPVYESFDIDRDYRLYVDGKPRYDGIQSFFDSRQIKIPYGQPDDAPDQETICGLGNRKNLLFHQQLQAAGVHVYESTIRLIRELRERGFKVAIISASENCSAVLQAAEIQYLFDAQVDGVESTQPLPARRKDLIHLSEGRRQIRSAHDGRGGFIIKAHFRQIGHDHMRAVFLEAIREHLRRVLAKRLEQPRHGPALVPVHVGLKPIRTRRWHDRARQTRRPPSRRAGSKVGPERRGNPAVGGRQPPDAIGVDLHLVAPKRRGLCPNRRRGNEIMNELTKAAHEKLSDQVTDQAGRFPRGSGADSRHTPIRKALTCYTE